MLAYTIQQQGKSATLSCSNSKVLNTEDWDIATSFLLTPCGDSFAVVYNLDNFVDILTNLLEKKLKDKILEGGRNLIDNRLIYYQVSRILGINHINFYGLKRYADTEPLDVHKLFDLANKVVNAYKKMGLEATKLTSPIAVFASKLNELNFPRSGDLPDNALPLTDACSKVMTREWRDTYKLGHWNADEITDLDLTSAYPSLVAELPDLTEAKFFSSDTMPQTYSWGELQGTLTINKPISPFFCEKVNGYPIGTWEDSITTDELWLLQKYQLGTFVMKHGDFFTLPPKYNLPFKTTMTNLYKARSNPDEIVQRIAKGISVGIWGKFAERYENRLGDHFNSIYARMTTSRCLVKVAAFIYHQQLESRIISVTVDGILTEGKVNVSSEKKIGQWRTEHSSPALVLSQLYQWINDKKPNMLLYPEMIELINKNPNNSVYGELDFHLLEYSRKFAKLPRNGKEFLINKYNSEPIKI